MRLAHTMIRVKDVVSISDEQEQACQDAVKGLEGAKLLDDGGWDHELAELAEFLQG